MTVHFETSAPEQALVGATIFVSASIPDPQRWNGPADPLAITDAVVSLARVFLTAGARVVTAAHPTIAPLLLYVASELPAERPPEIVTYQSDLFEDVLPADTRRFEREEIGRFVWTPQAEGEAPVPGSWDQSLDIMRRQMLTETRPSAAMFIGGMEGIIAEYSMFTELFPGAPCYPLGRPGGESRHLVERVDSPLASELRESRIYPALWRTVLADLTTESN
jgi:hypothetical protein